MLVSGDGELRYVPFLLGRPFPCVFLGTLSLSSLPLRSCPSYTVARRVVVMVAHYQPWLEHPLWLAIFLLALHG